MSATSTPPLEHPGPSTLRWGHWAKPLPVWLLLVATLGLGAAAAMGLHYARYAVLNPYQVVLSLFLLLNLLVCCLELCLLCRIDHIAWRSARLEQDTPQRRQRATLSVLTRRVPLLHVLSATFWSEIWASYSVYDPAYADKRSFGFAADVGNGIVTLIPAALFLVGMTYELVPARVLGLLGLVMFYQMAYLTGVYWLSFFLNGRHRRLTGSEVGVVILGVNAIWVIVPVLGAYVSVQLVLSNTYALLRS